MREAIDNWAKARATSRREKVPNKHLVMMVMVMKVMKVMVMVNLVMMVLTTTTMIQKI